MIRSSSTPSSGGSGRRSILFRTTICGSASRPAPYAASSRSICGPLLGRLAAADVDHMHEHPRALEVREELVAEPDALARALDQPGHVRHGQLAPVGSVDRPEHRLDRRERVARDLRPRVRDPPSGATTCRRSAGRRVPRPRAASAAARPRPPRRADRPRRTAASGASRWRSGDCLVRPTRRARARPARPGS